MSTTIGRPLPSLSTALSTGNVDPGHASCLVSAEMGPRARALVTAGEGGLLARGEPLGGPPRFPPGDSAHPPRMPEVTQGARVPQWLWI